MPNESANLNPYAPASDLDDVDLESFPQDGITFDGQIDVGSISHTDQTSLVIGLLIALGFVGVLLVGALSNSGAAVVLVFAIVVTLFAVFGFVPAQTSRPLTNYRWMNGRVSGRLCPERLDIGWNGGESSACFAFPQISSPQLFSSGRGRLFVLRALPCFIPAEAVEETQWGHVRDFQIFPMSDSNQQLWELTEPPQGAEALLTWKPADDTFQFDRAHHDRIIASPWVGRIGIFQLLLVGVYFISARSYLLYAAIGLFACFFGYAFFKEAKRRNWIRATPPRRIKPQKLEYPPQYDRWMSESKFLVGFNDAWICLPWESVQRATITEHAIVLNVAPLLIDSWMFERGDREDGQWNEVIRFVVGKVPTTKVWGRAREVERVIA